MNNKSFYATVAFVAIVDLIFIIHPVGYALLVTRAILCGASLYYIVKAVKEKKKINFFYFPFMVIFAVLYNPVAPFILPEGIWLLMDMVALGVFYFLSRSIALPDGITHKEIFPDDEQQVQETLQETVNEKPLREDEDDDEDE